ncbi:unnamed protein product [Ilex paraguariensis]|uniref:Uncharacterized protein n=1 Tax=Ilex paraguariensis TaxID=185542 RepID=A0ABC8U553_9AQUA
MSVETPPSPPLSTEPPPPPSPLSSSSEPPSSYDLALLDTNIEESNGDESDALHNSTQYPTIQNQDTVDKTSNIPTNGVIEENTPNNTMSMETPPPPPPPPPSSESVETSPPPPPPPSESVDTLPPPLSVSVDTAPPPPSSESVETSPPPPPPPSESVDTLPPPLSVSVDTAPPPPSSESVETSPPPPPPSESVDTLPPPLSVSVDTAPPPPSSESVETSPPPPPPSESVDTLPPPLSVSVDTPPPSPSSESELLSTETSSPPPTSVNICNTEIIEENAPNKSYSSHSPKQVQTTQNQNTDGKPAKKPAFSIKAKIKKFSVRALRDRFTSKRKPQPASKKLDEQKKHVDKQVKDASEKLVKLKKDQKVQELRKLKKTVTKLKLKVPPNYKIDAKEKDPHGNRQPDGAIGSKEEIPPEVLKKMPKLYNANTFENSWEFQDFMARFSGLRIELKLCLSCFAVFPEDAIIKKRLMVYWWIGEGFVPPINEGIENPKKTAEEHGNDFFDKLMELGFIEPVNERWSLVAGSCRMHPFMRNAVVTLAERAKFFDFDPKGYPMVTFGSSYRACLLGTGFENTENFEKLHMLFNVRETILEFEPTWLLRMRDVNVFHLGRWKASATQHVEVEKPNFLEGLKKMKHLRFFSLQGISGITELPECISQLTYLMILDLRACHDLEVIPEGIGSLESLTHLDMSECYLLEHMPRKLAKLTKLQVLKGFVVGDKKRKDSSCTLDDLAKLPGLTKLSIYTCMKIFPEVEHVNALGKFPALLKLTIEWGGGASQRKPDSKPLVQKTNDGGDKKKDSELIATGGEKKKDNGLVASGGDKKKDNGLIATAKKPRVERALSKIYTMKHPTIPTSSTSPTLPSRLKKLDLKCFPKRTTADWLKPANLQGLEKLYIRGGKFFDLGQFQDLARKDKWAVEQLRLKYLTELEVDWRELQELFPNLFYLEKEECPKLSFFPCNASGVWMNKMKIKQKVEGKAVVRDSIAN